MKKILTLAIGLFASIASLNAQVSCEFTYSGDTSTGTYQFVAPPSFPALLYTFEWIFNYGSTYAYGPDVVMTYNQSTIDSVTLNVYGSDSLIACVSVMAVNILVDSVNQNCPISYFNSPGNPNLFTFSSPGSNYPPTWFLPNGVATSGFEVDYVFDGAGNYEICMNITGGGFTCDNCITVTVPGDTIINPDPVCNADFWVSTSSLVGYFVPTYYAMLNSSAYAWTFGDGTSSTEQYPYHVYDAPGYYDVCLTYTSGPCSDYLCQTVYIPEYSFPPIDSSCYSGYIITQENPYEVTIVNAATGNNLEFTWTLSGNGISMTASGAYPSITVQSTGDFLFCLDVISADSCYASYCDSISIGDNGVLGGRISAAGFSINVVSPQAITGFVTGIEETESVVFDVYPNPFNDFLVVKNVSGQTNYTVFSIDGRKIATGNITGDNQVISTSALSTGMYVLQLISSEGQIATQKIIKK